MDYRYYDPNLLLINVGLWIIMFALCKPILLYRHPNFGIKKSNNFNLVFIILFVYSTFAFSEYDTYHTWFDFTFDPDLKHYEPAYRWLAAELSRNYFLWRGFVWGIACLSIYLSATILRQKNMALLLTVIFFLPTSYFVATRGASGHALALLGALFVFGGDHHKKRFLLGITLFIFSYFLHRSNFLFILFILITYFLPIKFNKKSVIISIILYPILSSITTIILNGFNQGLYSIEFGNEMEVSNYAMIHISGESSKLNIYGIIGDILRKAPIFLAMLYITYKIAFKNLKINKTYRFLYKLSYICVYSALLFIFQDTSSWIYQRILFFSLFPLIFILSKIIVVEIRSNKWTKIIFLSCILSILFIFSYTYYSWSKI